MGPITTCCLDFGTQAHKVMLETEAQQALQVAVKHYGDASQGGSGHQCTVGVANLA